MWLYYTVQAHEDTIAYVSARATPQEAQTELASVLYDKMDHELLRECGHVDEERVRLLYLTHDFFLYTNARDSVEPYHPLRTDGVHFLSGPKASEFMPLEPIPPHVVVLKQYPYELDEYKVERLHDLYFGVYLGSR